MRNFNFPYISQSLAEFWHRWHISLSTWLREYLYIPLGGNRRGVARTYLNIIIVMLLGGLWHGAAWSYAVWGGVHGCGLALERLLAGARTKGAEGRFSIPRAIAVFCFVTVAWLFFKLPDIHDVFGFARACIANIAAPSDSAVVGYMLFYSLPIVFYHLAHLYEAHAGFAIRPGWKNLAYASALVAIAVNSGSPGAFIYFQF